MSFVKQSLERFVNHMRSRRALVTMGVMLSTGVAAHAVPLAPGAAVLMGGTSSAARPDLAGVVVRDVIRPFAIPNGIGGTLARGWVQDRVVRSSVTGRLHFYYRVQNDATSLGRIDYIRRANFSGFATDVDFRWDGAGTIGVRRAFRSGAPGAVLTYDYTPRPIFPSEQSRFTFCATNAWNYNLNGVLVVTAYHPAFGYRSTSLGVAQPM